MNPYNFDVHFEKNLPLLRVSRRQLEEILFNIIVNAYHAMPDGGVMRISGVRDGDMIKITCQDTGCGISSMRIKHIFKPFYTTKTKRGLGLGLYITEQLVQLNGGRNAVESKLRQGTSLNIFFQAA